MPEWVISLVHVVSGLAVCLCAVVVLHVAHYRRHETPESLRAILIPLAGLVALAGVGRLMDDIMLSAGNAVAALAVGVVCFLGVIALAAILYSRVFRKVGDRRAGAGPPSPNLGLIDTLLEKNHDLEGRIARRSLQLEETKRRFEMALSGTDISAYEQDLDLRYVWLFNPPAGLTVEQMLGRTSGEVVSEGLAERLAVIKRRVIATGQPERTVLDLELGGEQRWFEERIEPVYRDGEITGVMTVAVDVTAHKKYERHLHLLLREITHRSKNLLAVVQGIARKTAETVQTPAEFIGRFGPRLQALSGAHDMLVGRSWTGVDLRELILREFENYASLVEGRVTLSGRDETLGLEAAQNLALGFYEMASNAILHGSLSAAEGTVAISWGRVELDTGTVLEVHWVEQGGPEVAPDSRAGFGRALIERLVPLAIEGTSDLTFDPAGLRWRLRIPVHRLSDSV